MTRWLAMHAALSAASLVCLAGCGDSAPDNTDATTSDGGKSDGGKEVAETAAAAEAGAGEPADANGVVEAGPSDETSRDAEAGGTDLADADAGSDLPSDGGTDATETGALDPSADVRKLTGSALAEFCDWVNETLGGYGRVADCSGNTMQVDVDQAACVSAGFHPRCAVSVAQYRTCVLAQVPSRGCNLPYESCHPLVCQ